MSALATLRDVTVTYRTANRPAITGVNLAVHPGELILIAGPSGCGKSTVMRALNGLVPHAYRAEVTGSIQVDGTDTTTSTIRDIAHTVGTLLQNPAKQVVGHSVLADIAFGLENRGLPAAQILDRVHDVADALQIGSALLDAATHELSGGQLQLVAFAGILALQPKLIIADEPLANLDPDAADQVLRALRRHVDNGGAAVVIEHRVDDVVPIAPDRVLYLDNGLTTYTGDLAGFLRTADPGTVKLPFDALIARAADLPTQRPATPVEAGFSLLRYDGATIGYGSAPILSDIDADLLAGQHIAVLGRNGAGKSTLLRAAVGLVQVLEGRVTLAGREMADYRATELTALCGYLFQNPAQALFAGTVDDELAFGPRNLGFEDAEIRTVPAEALAAVGLSDVHDIGGRAPRTLSFGEQRRLALALALTLRPRTLILDEPTAGQDERSATHFLDAIWALPDIESIYFITHDIDLALWRSDRVIVVDDGRLVADGTPRQIVDDTTLWHAEPDPGTGRAVLRETAYVRAVRSISPLEERIPPPHELARQLSRSTAAPR
ncbi:ABC transporter ATP-binding protein [Mycolicibacterium fluoranthenivorans]|uniref:Energy-coupling factor transport system ATP-binding protein n=1 Tax=Mycolicibacterium fluoranthenivorans TaxID=258505 RepID=A0A1G4V9W5_9MYCO|nr:ABC transporter ATP-binding protein [Mycolicibacterium fluoranthenivorans]SCX02651.1 energy-coupling factor transport system ATP-binding protein [Mycolicibacterium fluoranthenivorans]